MLNRWLIQKGWQPLIRSAEASGYEVEIYDYYDCRGLGVLDRARRHDGKWRSFQVQLAGRHLFVSTPGLKCLVANCRKASALAYRMLAAMQNGGDLITSLESLGQRLGNRLIRLGEYRIVHDHQWAEMKWREREWAHRGWIPMNDSEEDEMWSQVEERYGIKTFSVDGPTSCLVWNLSDFPADPPTPDVINREIDLGSAVLHAFDRAGASRTLTVMDLNHPCYWVDRVSLFEGISPRHWPVSIFPDDPYLLFLDVNFSCGLFASGYDNSVRVFGRLFTDYVAEGVSEILGDPRQE